MASSIDTKAVNEHLAERVKNIPVPEDHVGNPKHFQDMCIEAAHRNLANQMLLAKQEGKPLGTQEALGAIDAMPTDPNALEAASFKMEQKIDPQKQAAAEKMQSDLIQANNDIQYANLYKNPDETRAQGERALSRVAAHAKTLGLSGQEVVAYHEMATGAPLSEETQQSLAGKMGAAPISPAPALAQAPAPVQAPVMRPS